jgi:hypothetical protein
MKLSTLRKMDELQTTIEEIWIILISILNLVKYSKQTCNYYKLPTSQEQSFILSYAKNATKDSKTI